MHTNHLWVPWRLCYTMEKQNQISALEKTYAAAFYCITSTAVIFLNKVILSEYQVKQCLLCLHSLMTLIHIYFQFGDFIFVSLSQFFCTVLAILVLHIFKVVEIPGLSFVIFTELAPVSFMFMGNVVSGLGSTRSLSLPMFTALRRFSIMMTMGGEYLVLSKVPSLAVVASVAAMVGGALVAAAYDLAFNTYGYALVFTNNVFTALSGVYLKKASSSVISSKTAVLFYNSLFSSLALFLYYGVDHMLVMNAADYGQPPRIRGGVHANKSVQQMPPSSSQIFRVVEHPAWGNPHFLYLFALSAIMGSVLNYSIFLCTAFNSALTTAVIGCMKNVITTYVGMVLFSGYSFSILNFIGINISVIGSLYYTYVTLKS